MSVQTTSPSRPAPSLKPTGIYLMELRRRHLSEAHAKRQRLLVGSWTTCEGQIVPIVTRLGPRIQP